MRRTVWLTLIVAINAILTTISPAQINSYISSKVGFWQDGTVWSLGQPPSVSQSETLITNAANTTVSIDNIAATAFQDTLTISNLTINPPQTNNCTVLLDNTGSVPLHILDTLNVGLSDSQAAATLMSINSTLIVDGVSGGEVDDNGTIIISGGSLITTNCNLAIGFNSATGILTITNGGFVEARNVMISDNSAGTLQIIGSAFSMSGSLFVSDGGSEGSLLIADGAMLSVTGQFVVANGALSGGNVQVSNAALLAENLDVGFGFHCAGGLGIEDGTVTLNGDLNLGGFGSFGGCTLNGGVLTVSNTVVIGTEMGVASVTIQSGLLVAENIGVAANYNSEGTLTINGGVTEVISNLQVGDSSQSFATLNLNDGQLLVPNGEITVGNSFCCDIALIAVRGGLLAANYIDVGVGDPLYGGGTLTISGGSLTVSAGIKLGDCFPVFTIDGNYGYFNVEGGQTFITNAAGTGFIDVQHGELAISGGTLQVDVLVMTNTCSSFSCTGGTLKVGKVVVDPNNFGIVSVTPQGNDMLITWLMGPGRTNALQASSGDIHGNYATNNFTDIFIVTNNATAGTLTNFLDIGAATNKSRFYRARLSP